MEEKDPLVICPLCGKELNPGINSLGIPFHECGTDGSVEHSTLNAQPETAVATISQDRVVPCPKCRSMVNVGLYDPLTLIGCPFCQEGFELLKEFGEFNLLQRYDVDWQTAVYLGQRKGMEQKAIIKVLSSKVLNRPGAICDFLQEADAMIGKIKSPSIRRIEIGKVAGFQFYFALFRENTNPKTVLKLLEIDLPLRVEVADEMKRERKVQCPKCHAALEVVSYDPLDKVVCDTCGKEFDLHRIFGDYRIDFRLNSGGTSMLYLAQNMRNSRKVALKVLSASEMQRNPESVTAFMREIGMVENLIHSTLVKVFEGGEWEGYYWMAMELVDGLSLSEILGTVQREAGEGKVSEGYTEMTQDLFRKGLPELFCIEVMMLVAQSLGVVHEKGLVHGDVKPENIMITFDGKVKVLDFGLFRFANMENFFKDGPDALLIGTPLYIPPERVRGEPENFRSDYYGLGASLYHLLRGIAPFRARKPEEVALMHVKTPILAFKTYAPWVSDVTCRIIEKSLKKDTTQRYSSSGELLADLSLARQNLINGLKKKPKTGQQVIKEFMKSMPHPRKNLNFWRRATTRAVHVYRYVTVAITRRFLQR